MCVYYELPRSRTEAAAYSFDLWFFALFIRPDNRSEDSELLGAANLSVSGPCGRGQP